MKYKEFNDVVAGLNELYGQDNPELFGRKVRISLNPKERLSGRQWVFYFLPVGCVGLIADFWTDHNGEYDPRGTSFHFLEEDDDFILEGYKSPEEISGIVGENEIKTTMEYWKANHEEIFSRPADLEFSYTELRELTIWKEMEEPLLVREFLDRESIYTLDRLEQAVLDIVESSPCWTFYNLMKMWEEGSSHPASLDYVKQQGLRLAKEYAGDNPERQESIEENKETVIQIYALLQAEKEYKEWIWYMIDKKVDEIWQK